MSFASIVRKILLIVVVAIVAWAFFDYGRRFVWHRQQLAERPIELTVMHWGDPAEDKIVADLVTTYERDNPKVRINRINPGAGGFDQKLMTMMAADTPPDVFYLRPDTMPRLAELKLIAPMDPFIAATTGGATQGAAGDVLGDFFPVLLDGFRFDPESRQLGKGNLYALPKDFTTAVFWANADLLDRAGVDWRAIQKNGWTWDDFEREMKKVRALSPAANGAEIYGSLVQIWPGTLRNIIWTFGGEFFDKGPGGDVRFDQLALDEPPAQKALQLIARMRLEDRTAFNSTGIAKDGGQEFKNGNIGVIGPIGRWMVPQYKSITAFKWDALPVPRGTEQASSVYYTGWGMSPKSRHAQESYNLIRFLCGPQGQVQQARAGLAIPSLKSVAYSDDFRKPPGIPPHDSEVFLKAIDYARIGPMPRETEFAQLLDNTMNQAIQAGSLTPAAAAQQLQEKWTAELATPLRARAWPKMPWAPIVAVAAGVGATVVALLWWRARREKLGLLDRAQSRAGFGFVSIWVIGFLVFTLGPMIVSLLLAFSEWSGLVPLRDARFVGATNFRQLFTYDPTFAQSLKVTAYYVVLGVPTSQIAALAIAILMNSRVRGIAAFRTIYFVPSVVSGVALSMLWLQLFNNDYGLINKVLRFAMSYHTRAYLGGVLAIGGLAGLLLPFLWTRRDRPLGPRPAMLFIGGAALTVGLVLLSSSIIGLKAGHVPINPPNWFGNDPDTFVNDAARWAIPGFVMMSLWGVGGGMIIYLAGLKGIPVSLYEAARIDGASPWRQFTSVTLPMLSPLIFYNLVMAIIGSFQVFTQAFVMTGAGPENATLFYVLQLYYQAFEYHNMGYASAMAWVLFVIVLALTLAVFRGSKKLVYYEGLKT
jgi:multiple sugar transport system permease protein